LERMLQCGIRVEATLKEERRKKRGLKLRECPLEMGLKHIMRGWSPSKLKTLSSNISTAKTKRKTYYELFSCILIIFILKSSVSLFLFIFFSCLLPNNTSW
jgi:hypothetical protein